MRNFYKSADGSAVWEFDDDQVDDGHVPDGLIRMSTEEINSHLNPPVEPMTRESVNALRRAAYADSLTGSDPLYIEYQREIESGASAEVMTAAKEAWLGRAAEIAAEYPWPE